MATPVQTSSGPAVSSTIGGTSIPTRSVEAPQGAFGGFTAQALSNLGTVEQKSGDELMSRAIALQQVNEDAKANEARAAYTIKAGELYADYTTKSGSAAVDGYKPFTEALSKLRGQMKEGLGSEYAQRAFDAHTQQTMAQTVFSAAKHAGEEGKNYAVGAAQASVASSRNMALVDPTNDQSFQSGLAKTIDDVQHQGDLLGWSPEVRALKLSEAKSGLYSDRIQGLAKTQPFLAKSMLEKATKEGNIVGGDIAKISNYVTQQTYAVGGRQIASGIMNGEGARLGQGEVPIEHAMNAIGAFESSDRYNLIHPPAKNGDHALGRYGIMAANVSPWLKEAGMPNMTQAEFLQDSGAQDKLFQFKFGQYMKQYGSFNAAASMWIAGTVNPKTGANDGNVSVPEYINRANSFLAKSMSGSELSKVARDRAQETIPNDPTFSDQVEAHVLTQHSKQLQLDREDQFNDYQTVVGAAIDGTADGKKPTTIEELTADPSTKDAWDRLQPNKQQQIMKRLEQNSKQDYAWTPDKMKLYQQVIGAANDPSRSQEDTEALLNKDVMDYQFPRSATMQLIKVQQGLLKGADANPKIAHAIGVLKNVMADNNIKKRAGSTNTEYNQFTGALTVAMSDFMRENKRWPDDKELQDIGSRLVKETVTSPGLIYDTKSKFFSMPVPDEAKAIIKRDWSKRTGAEPTESQIHDTWIAKQYQEQYGKVKPSVRKASSPQAPMPQ